MFHFLSELCYIAHGCYGFVTNAIFSPDVAVTEEVERERERERRERERERENRDERERERETREREREIGGREEGELLIKF